MTPYLPLTTSQIISLIAAADVSWLASVQSIPSSNTPSLPCPLGYIQHIVNMAARPFPYYYAWETNESPILIHHKSDQCISFLYSPRLVSNRHDHGSPALGNKIRYTGILKLYFYLPIPTCLSGKIKEKIWRQHAFICSQYCILACLKSLLIDSTNAIL